MKCRDGEKSLDLPDFINYISPDNEIYEESVLRKTIKIFKALSDPHRVRIVKMLEERTLCVCEITEVLKLAPSTVSKHLSILRDAELIEDSKEGRWVNYSLNRSVGNTDAVKVLEIISGMLNSDELIMSDLRETRNVDRKEICGD